MSKTAIVLGATGLTGGLLTQLLLDDDAFAKVKLFSRNASAFKHPKVEENLCDLLDPDTFRDQFYGDVVFCCIGTTKEKTPDHDTYRSIDYGIPVSTAQLAKKHEIPTFLVISSMGADPSSRFFYMRTKGEMERDLLAAEIPNTFLLKPAFIDGRPSDERKGEGFLKTAMHVMDFLLIGPLKKYASTPAKAIARAMIQLAKDPQKDPVIENTSIKKLAAHYESESG